MHSSQVWCLANCYHGALVQQDKGACLDPWFCILAVPVLFKQPLENKEMEEGKSVSLRCELTKADATVVWKKGEATLQASAKYEMKQKGTVAELVIHNAEPEDAGRYTCDTGEQQTTAQVKIHGRNKTPACDHLLLFLPWSCTFTVSVHEKKGIHANKWQLWLCPLCYLFSRTITSY